jgi:hypothetical protein
LQIKGWVSAGSLAGFALGMGAHASIDNRTLLIISSFALCFWYLETIWKLFQYSITDRIRIIEAHFRHEEEILFKDPEPLQIYNWWFRSFNKDEAIYSYEKSYRPKSKFSRFCASAKQPFVHLPYSLIVIICLSLYILQNY